MLWISVVGGFFYHRIEFTFFALSVGLVQFCKLNAP